MIISLVECNANLRPHSPFHGEYCHSKDAEGASAEGGGGVAAIIRSTQKGQRKGKEKGGDKKVARSLQVVESRLGEGCGVVCGPGAVGSGGVHGGVGFNNGTARTDLYFGNWRWGGGVQWVAGQRGWEGSGAARGSRELVIQIHIQIRGKRESRTGR